MNFHKFISNRFPRWFNCLYASLLAYFWLPCPLCNKNFGGHEWFNGNSLYLGNGNGVGICSNCRDEAKRRNEEKENG